MKLTPPHRRLLVPLDGSEPSRRALAEAIALARALNARLRLMHVLDPRLLLPQAMEGGQPPEQLLDQQSANGASLLDRAVDDARQAGVQVETVLRNDPPVRVSDQILAETRDWQADLVVMGTHGRRGLRRVLLGSDAESVLRASPVPVLLVRGED
jgi:nucleotide-binding universal stress UspA family protein